MVEFPAGDVLPVCAQEVAGKVIVEATGEVEAFAGCAVRLSRGLRRALVAQVDGGADVEPAEIEAEFQACNEVEVFPAPALELRVHAVYLEEIGTSEEDEPLGASAAVGKAGSAHLEQDRAAGRANEL